MVKHLSISYLPYAILALGASVCLSGALIMVAGEAILGENHAGIAAVVGIVGIGIMGLYTQILVCGRARGRGT